METTSNKPNTLTETLAKKVVQLAEGELKAQKNVVHTLIYALCVAHIEKAIPATVNLLEAYKSNASEAKARNEQLLTHLFHVLELVTTKDGPRYRQIESVNKKTVAMLKQRINRALLPVAWILSHVNTENRLNDIVTHDKDYSITVKGLIYYSAKDMENAPNKATNWLTIDGKDGTIEGLITRAKDGLKFKPSTREGSSRNGSAVGSLKATIATTQAMLDKLQEPAMKAMGKDLKNELHILWEKIGAVLNVANEPISTAGKQVATIKAQASQAGKKQSEAIAKRA